MKAYNTADEMWLDTVQTLLLDGDGTDSRDGETVEIVGFAARLLDPFANFLFNPARKMSAAYAAAELLWYLSGTNEIEFIKEFAPQYERFSDDGVTAYGAYGYRWNHSEFRQELFKAVALGELDKLNNADFFSNERGKVTHETPISQLQALVWLLKTKPETRQAILVQWTPGDLAHALAGDKKDLPCTLSLHFLVREGALNLIVTMRSNDAWLGLPYDVFCFTGLQILIAEALGLRIGWYQHQAGSMHLYNRNKDKAHASLQPVFNTGSLDYKQHAEPMRTAILDAVSFADFIVNKTRCVTREATAKLGAGSFLEQCLHMLVSKWVVPKGGITNSILEKYLIERDK